MHLVAHQTERMEKLHASGRVRELVGDRASGMLRQYRQKPVLGRIYVGKQVSGRREYPDSIQHEEECQEGDSPGTPPTEGVVASRQRRDCSGSPCARATAS